MSAVRHHDNAAGPEEQRAAAGAEEPVAEGPEGAAAAAQPRQPPHALSRTLGSRVSHWGASLVYLYLSLSTVTFFSVGNLLNIRRLQLFHFA